MSFFDNFFLALSRRKIENIVHEGIKRKMLDIKGFLRETFSANRDK